MLSQLYAPRDIWVGMQYNVALRTYSWMDSTPVTFTKWYNKKPDPRVGQYVKVGVNDGRRSLFWFPAAKTEKHPFFCKKYPGLCVYFAQRMLLCGRRWWVLHSTKQCSIVHRVRGDFPEDNSLGDSTGVEYNVSIISFCFENAVSQILH